MSRNLNKLIDLNYQLGLIKSDRRRIANNLNGLRLTTFWTFLYSRDTEKPRDERVETFNLAVRRRRKMLELEQRLSSLRVIRLSVNAEIKKVLFVK